MQVDAVFQFAKVYDVTRMDVVKGQEFELLTDLSQPANVFADNDKVLSIDFQGANGKLKATEAGTSHVLFMDGRQIIKELTISVIDEIVPMAASLGLSADAPVLK